MNRYPKILAIVAIATIAVLLARNETVAAHAEPPSPAEASTPVSQPVMRSNGELMHSAPIASANTEVPVFADILAAHRRATELVHCIQLNTAKHDAELRLTWTTQNMSIRDVERHEQVLASLKATIERLEANHACSGVTVEAAMASAYPTLLAAAKLGDMSAAACYANAIAPLPEQEKNPQGISAFRTTANEFVAEGIARGDSRFVEIMTHATGSPGHRFDWFGHLVPPSREQGYRYRKLLRLMSTGSLAVDLDEELASLAKHLAPEVVQAMDAQAQSDYNAHFVNSPLLNTRPTACEMNEAGI